MVVGHFPIAGKICVVTGGGSGIGLAFVKLALESGGKCLIADINLTLDAQQLLDSSKELHHVKCDVTDWSDLAKLPSEIETAFGEGAVADIWVPAAGIFEPKWSSWLYDTEDSSYATMMINAEHPLKLTRIAMRSLLGANKPGIVVLLSSMAGVQGTYACPLYVASKHAVVGFAKSMAQADVDENVKVVCVCPGIVDTPLWTGDAAKDVKDQYGFTKGESITADNVALAMKEMIEDEGGKYPGGSLLGIAKGREREPLESGQAILKRPDAEAYANHLYEPIRSTFRTERAGNNAQ